MSEAHRVVRMEPPRRPERVVELDTMGTVGDAARPLSVAERLLQITGVRRLIVVVVLCIAWQVYASWLNNNLLFPTLTETLEALYDAVVNGPLIQRTLTSLQILLMGYALGLAIAGIFTTLAITTRVGTDFLSTLTAMFNPLPAIALLPLALLWFGLGAKSLVFVIIHSVLWAVALNTHSGFTSVSPTLRMAGQNCGLRGISYVAFLLGFRVAHADRRRARVRGLIALGRARLVHLREPQPARNPFGVRRPVDRDPDRARGRERDLPFDRERHDQTVGDAELT
jgi:NitT/TauT family transport system permease protein